MCPHHLSINITIIVIIVIIIIIVIIFFIIYLGSGKTFHFGASEEVYRVSLPPIILSF